MRLVAGTLLLGLAAASGCRMLPFGLGPPAVTVRSEATDSLTRTPLPTRVFTSETPNHADVYLTDLPAERLGPDRGLGGLTGTIVHIRMFVRPLPGRTPIENTATNATATYIVLADGEIGVYTGAGFFLPSGLLDGGLFGGELRDTTIRPEAATAGFFDRLGPSTLTVLFNARRDDEAAADIDRAIIDLVRRAQDAGGPANNS